MSQVLMTLPEVQARLGISRSAVLRAVKRGVIPSPVRIGLRSVRWYAEEIDGYISKAERIVPSEAEGEAEAEGRAGA